MTDTIYRRPEDYDLEHEGDERDIEFYRELVIRLRPRRMLELACGSGRLTIPLAEAAPEMTVVGVEFSGEMLELARRKLGDAGADLGRRVALHSGDMRTWSSSTDFDLVLLGCSSITHLLTLDDRLAVWRRAHALLAPGGRFVIDVTMPDIRVFAASLETPPRALIESIATGGIRPATSGSCTRERPPTTRWNSGRTSAFSMTSSGRTARSIGM